MGQGRGRAERRARARHRAGGGSDAPAGQRTGDGAQAPREPMILVIEDVGAVRVLTMNRPEKRNALDTNLTSALLESVRAADEDDAVRSVVLTGAGPGFCAGADLSEFKNLLDPKAAEKRAELTMHLHLAFSKMIKPVVTAINGAAMGGGAGLAIAGDMAVMAENAKLGYPE